MTDFKTEIRNIAQDLQAVSSSIDTIKEACPQEEYEPIFRMMVILQSHIKEDAAKLEKLAGIIKGGALQ